jgi:hypothetical protein
MRALDLVSEPLQRQLRALSVALRAGAPERAPEHAHKPDPLVNDSKL